MANGLIPWLMVICLWYPAADAQQEQEIRQAGLNPAPEQILQLIRRRSEPVPSAEQLQQWADQLAEKAKQEEAMMSLAGVGQPAVPLLRQRINNASSPEAADKARKCLVAIEGASGANLTTILIDQLLARNPNGTTEVLLRYLPQAEDETILAQIRDGLIALHRKDKTPDPALLAALKDPAPVIRAIAATVIATADDKKGLELVKPLLADPKPSVRFRVAHALVENLDGNTLPALVELLPTLPPSQRQELEEYLAQLAGEWNLTPPRGTDQISLELRKELWLAWWKKLDGATLMEEFRKRQPTNSEITSTTSVLTRLEDKNPTVVQEARTALLAMDPKVLPLIRLANLRGGSQTFQSAVTSATQKLAADEQPRLPGSSLFLLALRNPEGTLTTLLDWLPLVEDADQAEKLFGLINRLGWQKGEADPILLKTLQDPVLVRRVVAARVLLSRPEPELVARLKKLMEEPNLRQRWQIGKALMESGERSVAPALINLMADLPIEEAGEVEDFFSFLAGDKLPAQRLEADPMARARSRDAWLKWWTDNGAMASLERLKELQGQNGNLVLVENYNPTGRVGSVGEITRNGRELWRIQELMFPTDAQVLPGGRVMVAEQNINRISERNFKGKILWERNFPQPIFVRRLRNRQTVFSNRNQVVVIDSTGKDVYTHTVNGEAILAINLLPGDQIAYVTYNGNYIVLDASGKEIIRKNLFPNTIGVTCAHVLPGEHVLVGINGQGKIMEYNSNGKVVWEASGIGNPVGITKGPGGKVLVANGNTTVTELDRNGKVSREWKDLNLRVFQINPR